MFIYFPLLFIVPLILCLVRKPETNSFNSTNSLFNSTNSFIHPAPKVLEKTDNSFQNFNNSNNLGNFSNLNRNFSQRYLGQPDKIFTNNPFEKSIEDDFFNSLSPHIVITRVRTLGNTAADSLDYSSSENKSTPPQRKLKKRKNNFNRNRNNKKHKNLNEKKSGEGYFSRVLNGIRGISFLTIFLYVGSALIFTYIGYQLRKNEEESSYIQLAPQ